MCDWNTFNLMKLNQKKRKKKGNAEFAVVHGDDSGFYTNHVVAKWDKPCCCYVRQTMLQLRDTSHVVATRHKPCCCGCCYRFFPYISQIHLICHHSSWVSSNNNCLFALPNLFVVTPLFLRNTTVNTIWWNKFLSRFTVKVLFLAYIFLIPISLEKERDY